MRKLVAPGQIMPKFLGPEPQRNLLSVPSCRSFAPSLRKQVADSLEHAGVSQATSRTLFASRVVIAGKGRIGITERTARHAKLQSSITGSRAIKVSPGSATNI